VIRRRAAAAALGVVIVLASAGGCGGGINTGVSADAQRQLDLRVAAVRQSAEAGDMARANSSLADLTASVQTLQSQGKLDGSAGARILAAAEAVRSQLVASTPTSAPAPTTAPPSPAPAPGEHKKKGKDD
jgi:hypothetical protein